MSFLCSRYFRLPCRLQMASTGGAAAGGWMIGISTSRASRWRLGCGHFDQASRDGPRCGQRRLGQHIEISQDIAEKPDEERRNRSEPLGEGYVGTKSAADEPSKHIEPKQKSAPADAVLSGICRSL